MLDRAAMTPVAPLPLLALWTGIFVIAGEIDWRAVSPRIEALT